MPQRSQSHFAPAHWPLHAWAPSHWRILVESIDPLTSPRSCLLASFEPDAAFAGLFLNVQPALSTFDLLVLREGAWTACR